MIRTEKANLIALKINQFQKQDKEIIQSLLSKSKSYYARRPEKKRSKSSTTTKRIPVYSLPKSEAKGELKFKSVQDFATKEIKSNYIEPILIGGGIDFSIYASGNSESLNKEIHLRYHISGTLLNPYPHPVTLRDDSSPELFVEIKNIPPVQIINHRTGKVLVIDSIENLGNYTSGKQQIIAWIETPQQLQSAEVFHFTTPTPSEQPQGLERLISRSFELGLSDSIELFFEDPLAPLKIILYRKEKDGNLTKIQLLEAQSFGSKRLKFNRAANSNPSFYIGESSGLFHFSQHQFSEHWSFNLENHLKLRKNPWENSLKGKKIQPHLWIHPEIKMDKIYLPSPLHSVKDPLELKALKANTTWAGIGIIDNLKIYEEYGNLVFDQKRFHAIQSLHDPKVPLKNELWIKDPLILENLKSEDLLKHIIRNSFINEVTGLTLKAYPNNRTELKLTQPKFFIGSVRAMSQEIVDELNLNQHESISELLSSRKMISPLSKNKTDAQKQTQHWNLSLNSLIYPFSQKIFAKSDSVVISENEKSIWFQRFPNSQDSEYPFIWVPVQASRH